MSYRSAAETAARSRVILAGVFSVTAAIVGYALSAVVSVRPIGQPEPGLVNVFYYLYGAHERPFFLLLGLFTGVAGWIIIGTRVSRSNPGAYWERVSPAFIAGVVFIVGLGGSHLALHNYPLSMDEFNSVFQSRIFASGQVVASVPIEMTELIPAIKPEFVTYKSMQGGWLSGYLPVYAAMRAPFTKVGVDAMVNPLLGAFSILLLAAIGRRLWATDRAIASIAILLLATSSQFVVTTMSWYSMPAHLFLNLCWLLLYLRAGPRDVLLAPWVGVLAMGLHNPLPHALFVAPFLIRLFRSGRYRVLGYFCAVYLLGSLLWIAWFKFSLAPVEEAARRAFSLPGVDEILIQVMSVSLILSWQAPLFGLALVLAALSWRNLSETERDLAMGLAMTIVLYCFYPSSQGHGWGYRYIYATLGSAVILASAGVQLARRIAGDRVTGRIVAASFILAVCIALPLRLVQAERFVRPWADAMTFIDSLPPALVVIPTGAVWYGPDLIRNDPMLPGSRSIRVAKEASDSLSLTALRARTGLSVREMTREELVSFGLRSD